MAVRGQAIADLPMMNASMYASNTTSLANPSWGASTFAGGTAVASWDYADAETSAADYAAKGKFLGRMAVDRNPSLRVLQIQKEEEVADKRKLRIVKVFICDTNENIPLQDSILHSGEEKLTDANDQELFFELDVNGLLKTHNEKRVKIVDKSVKDRVEHLEPARVRDLTMTVVTVASF